MSIPYTKNFLGEKRRSGAVYWQVDWQQDKIFNFFFCRRENFFATLPYLCYNQRGVMYMAKTSKAQLLAQAKFKQEKRDTLTIDLPKGTKDGYKTSAAAFGMSLTFLIQCGVEEFIQNHAGEALPRHPAPFTTPAQKISASQRRLLDAVNQLPADAQKSLLKFLQSLNAQQVNTAAAAENAAENATVDAHEPT